MLYSVYLAWAGFDLTKLVVIDTDYIGSCKSNYNTITTTNAPNLIKLRSLIAPGFVMCDTTGSNQR